MDYKKILQYTKDLHILYVEDDEILLENTSEILEDYFDTLDTAPNGKVALDKYVKFYEKTGTYYDLIITDINMPIMNGEVLIEEILAKNPAQVIIVVSAYNESARLIRLIQDGITNFILKPIEPRQLIDTLYKTCKNIFAQKKLQEYYAMVDDQNRVLDSKVKELSKEILATQRLSIETIGNMVESYDDDTGSHVKRIEAYTLLLIKHLVCDDKSYKEIKEIAPFASLLHDVGKLIIPKNILQKPGKLTDEEFDVIKTHAELGAKILIKANEDFKKEFHKDSYFKVAADIAYYHHEKYNGKGYPKGLKGEEIPRVARIVAIADVYDALRSKRVYKDGFSHEKSVAIIKEERGESFDPLLVDIFLEINEEFDKVFQELNE
jgi:putative two-component system response regulator